MKRILVPIDFSDNSKTALQYALELINEETATIQLLHVVKPVVVNTLDSAMHDGGATELIVEKSQENLDALLTKSQEQLQGRNLDKVNLSTKVLIGITTDEINREAEKLKADLIIMGTRGANHSMINKLIGTISTKVIATSPCPVILIPSDYTFKKIDNIVFATNLDTGDPYELNRALNVLKPHTPLVRVIYIKSPVVKDSATKIESFAKYLVDHSPAIRTVFNIETSQEVEELINEYALRYQAELVVMHRTKKRLLDRIFGSSHTKKMAFHASTPLLILN